MTQHYPQRWEALHDTVRHQRHGGRQGRFPLDPNAPQRELSQFCAASTLQAGWTVFNMEAIDLGAAALK
jgi:hypothetical protein